MSAVPDVSVLLPVHDAGRYLEQSLASILRQSLRSIEIVAIDDGSTDGSGALLDEAARQDDRLRVLHRPNGGIVSALNAGLALVRGRYVARMDADDVAWADRLAIQRDALDARPDHVAVGSLVRVIDASGKVVRVQRPADRDRATDLRRFPPFVHTVPHPTLMVRAEAMRALGGYRSIFPHAEDQDLLIRLSRLGRIATLPQPLLDYRIHDAAASVLHRAAQLDSALAALKAGMIAERTGVDLADVAALANDRRLPPAAAWALLRATMEVDHHLDRRAPVAALRSMRPVARRFAAAWPALDGAARRRMLSSLGRALVRAGVMAVRG